MRILHLFLHVDRGGHVYKNGPGTTIYLLGEAQPMEATFELDTQWQRIVSELRAQRAAQKQAWGDLDNATLGRYLADEVSSAERAEIERTLDGLPELRRLTNVVRDVLAEFEPAAAPVPAPLPVVLPFQRPAVRPARTPIRRQRFALFAAAAVLLAVGLGVLHTSNLPTSPGLPRADRSALSRPEMVVAHNTRAVDPGPFFRAERALPPGQQPPTPSAQDARVPDVVASFGHGFTALLLDAAIAWGEREDERFAREMPAAQLLNSRKQLVALYDVQNTVARPPLRNHLAEMRNTVTTPNSVLAPTVGVTLAAQGNHADRHRGQNLEKRVVVLHYCLRHGDAPTQVRAANLLADLGAASDRAVPDLVLVLGHSEDPRPHAAAQDALVRLAPTCAPRLAALQLTGDVHEKKAACEVLRRVNSDPSHLKASVGQLGLFFGLGSSLAR